MKLNSLHRVFISLLCLTLLFGLIPGASAATSDEEAVKEAILQAYEDLATVKGTDLTIDIKGYSITVDELNEIVDSTGIGGDCLQPWYFDTYQYSYDPETDIVSSLTLTRLDPEEYDYDLYEQRFAEVLGATVFEGMSDWQMALSIQDYLASHIIYDQSMTYYSSYDALVRGTCVCSGYADLYLQLLHRVGIDSRYISSENMDHAWNIVELDGQWYHVDITWNDPVSDVYGRVRHYYFLLSDETLGDDDHGHYDWTPDTDCDDESLDTGCFWEDIDSPICYESAEVCYFREQTGETEYTIYRRDKDGDQTVVTTTDAGHIHIGGEEDYNYFYANYGLDLVGDRLYYADMTAVYSIKTDGTDKKTVYSHNYEKEETCIMGTKVLGDSLYLTLRDHEGNQSTLELELDEGEHVHSYAAEKVKATCSEPGYTLNTCECGISYRSNLKPTSEHNYDDGKVLKEATVTATGTMCYTCQDCAHTKLEEIPQLTLSGNNPLIDSDGVDEEEYMIRRILVGVGAVILILVIIPRRKRK